MAQLFSHLKSRLAEREHASLYRRRRIVDSAQGVRLKLDGREVLSFCSNDYLGLANHPRVIESFQRASAEYGVGSGAAHLISGHMRPHHELEEELAAFTGRERALLFSTGYMANIGVVTALLGRGDAVFEDRLNHASLIDAGLFSSAQFKRYPHADADALSGFLENSNAPNKLIVTDGVFSMDGDIAPLPQLVQAARQHSAWLMVDDAHGFGVLGKNGAGCCEQFGLTQDDVPVLMCTLGKAAGTFGAFVAGSNDLIEYLINEARTYVYTTALPPAVAEATRTSLRLFVDDAWRREQLHKLIQQFREGAKALGLELVESQTPVQPVVLGDTQRALRWSNVLLERGVLVTAIRPPTVPKGTARLRITLSAAHSEGDVDCLLESLDVLHRSEA